MAILLIKIDTKRLRYVPRRSSCLSLQGLRVEGTASISSGVSLIVGTRRNGKLACNEPRALLRRGAFHVWIALRAAFGDATALLLACLLLLLLPLPSHPLCFYLWSGIMIGLHQRLNLYVHTSTPYHSAVPLIWKYRFQVYRRQ